jgi:hypothetical protein
MSLLLPLLFGVICASAQAGIVASVSGRPGIHWTQDDMVGKPVDPDSLMFGGEFRSMLAKLSPRSCRTISDSPSKLSYCGFKTDASVFDSTYERTLLSRFGDSDPVVESVQADIDVLEDGSFTGSVTFIRGKNALIEDDEAQYHMSFNSGYQFYFHGIGISPTATMNAEIAEWMWSNADLSHAHFYVELWESTWNKLTQEYTLHGAEGWEGQLNVVRGVVPEPAAPFLFETGLLALLAQRAVRRGVAVHTPQT